MARFPVQQLLADAPGIRVLCRDESLADDVAASSREHPVRSGQRSVDQSLERLRINTAFGTRERDGLGRCWPPQPARAVLTHEAGPVTLGAPVTP